MDRVYSNAFFTIVAAAGSGSGAGLAGISRPRQKQGRVTVDRTQLIEIWDDGTELIKNSTWASRGWTFQEGYLSPRCLILTDREAIYLCNDEHATETQGHSFYEETKRIMKRFRWMVQPESKSGYWAVPDHLGPQIEEYSARSLSNEDDSLNAFLGILKHYELHAKSPAEAISHLWGITTRQADNLTYFDIMWRHQNVAKARRPGFPSWSWIGWNGAIEYECGFGYLAMALPHKPLELTNESKTNIEDTAWSIHINDGDRLYELSDFCRHGTQRLRQPKELWITALVLDLRIREVESRTCARFPIRDNTFIEVPVLFDRPFNPAIHTLGFIIPAGGHRTYTDCIKYHVIILQQVGEDRFERAGILDLSSGYHGDIYTCSGWGWELDAQDRRTKVLGRVVAVDFLFLHGSRKRSFWFV